MNTFITQFTGRFFWWILGALASLDLVSFLVLNTRMETLLFGAVVIAFIAFASKRPEWLFPLAMAEIIATSNGHSLNIELLGTSIGIRIALFAILMLATVFNIAKHESNPIPHRYRLVSISLIVVVIYALILGVLSGHGVREIYLDANGYLAIGYVFAAWVWAQDSVSRHRLLQAVGAGIIWITIKTFLFLGMFGHLHPKTLDPIYTWIRDTRLGEVTLQGGNIYRIFLQSQWFVVPAIIATSTYMWIGERMRENGVRLVFLASFAAILISMSRSFWVSLVVVVPILIIIIVSKIGWKDSFSKLPDFIALKFGSMALIWVIIAVPIYQTANFSFFSDMFAGRASGTSDIAIDSRTQLLSPMLEAIMQAPISGYGLGKTVTYETSDTRYIDDHNSTKVETYAFEWGWLDILIKFGVLGVFVLLWLAWLLTSDLWKIARIESERLWLYLTLELSLIGLFVVHIFTPYLNHPIGWGTIAIIVALIPFERIISKKAKNTTRAKATKRELATAMLRNRA